VSQLVVAYGLGMLALASPCGFAMLPAFLAYNVAGSGTVGRSAGFRTSRALGVGLGVGLGFALTFIAGGLLVSAGLRSITEAVPWFGVVVGVGLVVFGIAMALGRRFGMTVGLGRLTSGTASGPAPSIIFGVGYALTQLACGMGSLLALTGTGMAASSFTGTSAVFVAFGVGSISLLLLLALSTALMSDVLVRGVRVIAPFVSRISGVVLALAGVYLVTYWSPALSGGGSADNAISRTVHDTSVQMREWLGTHEWLVGGLTVLLLAIVGAAWLRARQEADGSTTGVDALREDSHV